jgi:quinol monooxygenase YgiN
MITRIVKLEFQNEKVEEFLSFFENIKYDVNNYTGCYGMQLLQDKSNPAIIFTYSLWESDAALDNYRNSNVFGQIWPRIKPWFASKPEAWTLTNYFSGMQYQSSN